MQNTITQVKGKTTLIVLMLLLANYAFAGSGFCSKQKRGTTAAKTTLGDLAEDNYDVKYLKFDLHLSDTTVYVSGNVLTMAKVVAPTMSQYVFELDTTLTIDSAKFNGAAVTATTTGGFIRTITLSTALTAGTMFNVQIYYHGMPPGGGGGFFNGITHTVTSGGTHVVYTISDPYVAKNWWPCKQSIPDKIDSVDMYISVPRGVADGSNGLLVNTDTTSVSGTWQYHWKTNYMIDYYLISIAVAKYSQYKNYHHFASSTDSVLIHNFFMDTASFNPVHKIKFDSLGMYIDYFSSLFGRYPFWKEKYGVCFTTLPGGMEHQTMTTIGVTSTSVIAHELCHQWFGDNVTYRTWGDMWLSEGFATFSEQLFLNHFWGPAAALANRSAYLNSYTLGSPCGKLYVDDTTNSDSLFNARTVYAKGQGVVRMLQYVAPSDSAFFQVLRTYQSNFALGHASTADLKAIAESVYGYNLDTFFNQWIYGRGYPIYNIKWNQSGSTVYVKVIQTTSCPTYTPRFSTPIELQLHATASDTFMKVYNDHDTTLYTFTWAPAITRLYLNPSIWTVCKQGTIARDNSLGIGAIDSRKQYKIYPNPTKNYWQIEDVTEGAALSLCDVSGKTIWEGTSQKGATTIPGQKLPAGNYFLKVGAGNDGETVKLIHW